MVVLGLTGSIGMGKTTVANALKATGAAVFDADAAVHRLLGPGGKAVAAVLARFPDAASGEGAAREVDRGALGAQVFADPEALAALEAILHPRVRAGERRFLAASQRRGGRLVRRARDREGPGQRDPDSHAHQRRDGDRPRRARPGPAGPAGIHRRHRSHPTEQETAG